MFGVGVLGVLLAVVPFFFGRQDAPSWTALTASLLPVGLGIALVGLLLGAALGFLGTKFYDRKGWHRYPGGMTLPPRLDKIVNAD